MTDKTSYFLQVDELESKLKDLEGICSPIITRMYQGGEGGAAPTSSEGGAGPKIEEVCTQ